MRNVIFSAMVSLDGFMEAPNQDLDWVIVDEELHNYVNEQVKGMGAFLYGRRTYETMVAYWPTADTDPTIPEYMAEFSRIWRNKPKFVFSKTLAHVEAGHTLIKDNVAEEITKLKEQPGKDLALGGADLTSTLTKHGLVDQYQLYFQPVALGAGTPFFKSLENRLSLKLLDTRTFASGVVLLHYRK